MKYESELIHEILEQRGHEVPDLHYQSECVEAWIEEYRGAYPKLCDYEGEWLHYILEHPIGSFPYETITTNSTATVNHVIPFAYQSAILTGSTKYRDIDTGEFLETFEEGRNLELVSVKIPVLTTTGKNLFDGALRWGMYSFAGGVFESGAVGSNIANTNPIKVEPNMTISSNLKQPRVFEYGKNMDFIKYSVLHDNIQVSEKTEYINFHVSGYDMDSEIIFANSDTPPTYEPFKSNILTVNEDVELRGIGNVKDELNLSTGELTQRIGEIVLDGSGFYINNQDETSITFVKDGNPMIASMNSCINNRFSNLVYVNGTIKINVNISEFADINEFKESMAQNNLIIQFHKKDESIKTVDLTVVNQDGDTLSKIKPIEGTMHVEVSGTPINPTAVLEVPVEAITQNLGSFIEEE